MAPGIEHDLIRIKHVLRILGEVQYKAWMLGRMGDEMLGCLDDIKVFRHHQSAIRKKPLDLHVQASIGAQATRPLPPWV